MHKTAKWITNTAIFMALLVGLQLLTAPIGSTLITGSIVNLLLILCTLSLGIKSGATLAVLSPVLAKFLGIGPLWELIPFVILGNLAIVLVLHLIVRKKPDVIMVQAIGVLCGAGAKFLVLYFGIVQIAIPLLLQLPQPQASVISAMFSISQLFTALLGGAGAILLFQLLKKAGITPAK